MDDVSIDHFRDQCRRQMVDLLDVIVINEYLALYQVVTLKWLVQGLCS